MSVFKEEFYQFEALRKHMLTNTSDGCFWTGSNEFHLRQLREVMADIAELRIRKTRIGNVANDVFFIAWEQDGNFYNGVVLEVRTTFGTPSKKVELFTTNASMPINCYDFYRGSK